MEEFNKEQYTPSSQEEADEIKAIGDYMEKINRMIEAYNLLHPKDPLMIAATIQGSYTGAGFLQGRYMRRNATNLLEAVEKLMLNTFQHVQDSAPGEASKFLAMKAQQAATAMQSPQYAEVTQKLRKMGIDIPAPAKATTQQKTVEEDYSGIPMSRPLYSNGKKH